VGCSSFPVCIAIPEDGLTLRVEVLTLKFVLRSAHRQSWGGFPEFTIARFVVCGSFGAGGAVLRGPGSRSAEPACPEPGFAKPGSSEPDF
jgi:hypothetical protein